MNTHYQILPYPQAFGMALAGLFALLFLLFYGGSSWLSEWIAWRIAPALPFEEKIPLLPAWSLVYLSMPLLLFYCVARLDWTALWSLFVILLFELLTACIFFLLFPVSLSYPPSAVEGLWQPWFVFATTLSMDNNHLPSLHVAFACSAAMALQTVLPRYQVVITWLWVFLIAVSTLFIHEHHVLDIIAGGILALLAQRFILPRAMRYPTLQRVRLEWLWWVNQYLFARRHRRYAGIALMITMQRILHPKRGNLLLSGYCFLQAVDDVMDGDRIDTKPPLLLAEQLITAWQQGDFDCNDDFMCLAQDFYQRLQRLPDGDTNRNAVSALLQVMCRDYLRATTCEVWTAKAIDIQHQKTFSLSLNLLLAALSSTVRADDVPELIAVLGRCSTMRDLREDLHNGIINIPAEVLPPNLAPPFSPHVVEQLLQHPEIITWLKQQYQQAQNTLKALDNRLLTADLDHSGKRIINIFARSLHDFAKRRFIELYPQAV